MNYFHELKVNVVLYLDMLDGESVDDAMDRIEKILSNTQLDFFIDTRSLEVVR